MGRLKNLNKVVKKKRKMLSECILHNLPHWLFHSVKEGVSFNDNAFIAFSLNASPTYIILWL